MNATVFELRGDHDSCLAAAARYGAATRAAVDDVARRSGLVEDADTLRVS